MANVSELKKGMVIRWQNDLWAIVDFQHVSPGKGSAFTRIKLRSLASQKVVENTFKATEALDVADVRQHNMQYLFSDDTSFTFMDMQSYEQVIVEKETVGDDAKYLKEGLQVVVALLEEKAVSIELPRKVEYVIAHTEPAVKGDTVSGNVLKDATADNGLALRVPIFIKEGDKVMINTETGEYSERVN